MRYHLGFFLMLLLFSCSENKNAVVYVNSVKLFEEFSMKTEYDKILEKDLKAEAQLVDSLQVLLEHSNDSLEIFRLRKDYYLAEQLFNDKFDKLSRNYTQSVTERLDDYIAKFAKKNNYQMIVSGNNGAVVYIDEKLDVTEELIKFANSEFEKK